MTTSQIKLRAKYNLPLTIAKKKKGTYVPPEEAHTRPDGNIDANGTKAVDNFGKFKSNTHVVAPVSNKAAYMVVSIEDIKTMGKKV